MGGHIIGNRDRDIHRVFSLYGDLVSTIPYQWRCRKHITLSWRRHHYYLVATHLPYGARRGQTVRTHRARGNTLEKQTARLRSAPWLTKTCIRWSAAVLVWSEQ